MRGKSNGTGFLLLLIVVVILLYLAARNGKAVAPAAAQLREYRQQTSAEPAAYGSSGMDTGSATTGTRLPKLSDMKQSTDEHRAAVQDTMAQSE